VSSEHYEPSPREHVREHVRRYEETGDVYSSPFEGQPTVILTTRGRKSGKLRKTPLVRVEHEGSYAVVASRGGAPTHPAWYLNLVADPRVVLQDGPERTELHARTATAAERGVWWPRAVAVWAEYAEYQTRTSRELPIVLFDPR
jgi:deazaflavin-dependent oxidoreductase (nitroreductase family)